MSTVFCSVLMFYNLYVTVITFVLFCLTPVAVFGLHLQWMQAYVFKHMVPLKQENLSTI